MTQQINKQVMIKLDVTYKN